MASYKRPDSGQLDTLSEDVQSQYPEPDAGPRFAWQGPMLSAQQAERANVSFSSKLEGDYDFLDEYPDDEDDSGDDSDTQQHRRKLSTFKKTVYALRKQIQGSDDESLEEAQIQRGSRGRGTRGRPRGRARGRARENRGGRTRGVPKGTIRGPRKAAELTGDIKHRMSLASQAFISGRYEDTQQILNDIIRINAETFEAWMLLANVWEELGDLDNAIATLTFAAHLRPHHVDVWLNVARFALEHTGDQRPRFLEAAKYAYSGAIRAAPKDASEARLGKALLLREMGNSAAAMTEYKHVLRARPHNMSILRSMAETLIDLGDSETAQRLYSTTFKHFRGSQDLTAPFDWTDVAIFVELYSYSGQHEEGLRQLRSLSRWLLGRRSEDYWDKYDDDDREWDAEDTRRLHDPNFDPLRFSTDRYGHGLPMELRVKLGVCRLRLNCREEAYKHFLWLDAENRGPVDMLLEYPHLFREVADDLVVAGELEKAIPYYAALQDRIEQDVADIPLQLGKCLLASGRDDQAEERFLQAVSIDDSSIEARIQLAKLCEKRNDQAEAFLYLNQIMELQKRNAPLPPAAKRRHRPLKAASQAKMRTVALGTSASKTKRGTDDENRRQREELKSDFLRQQYDILRAEQNGMEAGHNSSVLAWMNAAKDLTDDFRSFRTFYPWDKYLRFMGFSSRQLPLTGAAPLDNDIVSMAERLSSKLGVEANMEVVTRKQLPQNYRGISFADWLDIFLQYALCLAKQDRQADSYEICEAAKDSIVWYHNKEDLFLIHVCHCTCALFTADEETCLKLSRHFMTSYQFTTDAYRMFAALSKLMHAPNAWYCSGPEEKYMLRQIKAMDFVFVGAKQRKKMSSEKASYSKDGAGKHIVNDELDISLLMLYGHMLAAGSSYGFALNYYFRAYALDADNPMINLSIALAYIHHGIKRQSDNRQFHLMQGMSFLFRFYDSMVTSEILEQRQSAHYCVARTFHLLGLTHLALPYYQKVLAESTVSSLSQERLTLDSAYNLQTMYTAAGNFSLANAVTKQWLTV